MIDRAALSDVGRRHLRTCFRDKKVVTCVSEHGHDKDKIYILCI